MNGKDMDYFVGQIRLLCVITAATTAALVSAVWLAAGQGSWERAAYPALVGIGGIFCLWMGLKLLRGDCERAVREAEASHR